MWLNQGIVKLAPLEAVLMIGPRGSGHSAVGIQQYPEATHQQENQKQHQETNEREGRPLLGVSSKRWAAGNPSEGRPRQKQLIVQCGHIAHPPGRATAELASCLEGGLDWEVGQIGTVTSMWTTEAKVNPPDTSARVTDTQTDTSGAIRDFAAQNDRPVYFRPVTSDLTLKWHGASRWDMTQQAATVDKNSSACRDSSHTLVPRSSSLQG